jgi:Domain of unknown function (DUF4349)
MNNVPQARPLRGLLRMTALTASLMSGAALLLAGCSNAGVSSPSTGARAQGPATGIGAPAAAQGHGSTGAAPGLAEPASSPAAQGSRSGPPAGLAGSTASIIFTASLTVRVRSVATAASTATRIALSNGGYVSGENASINPGSHARPAISLQLKIPVTRYPGALDELSAELGAETSVTQQAQDVTEQVADTNSQVASAQAAIAQLRTLLARAGSVSDLLTVQDQINSEESSLEQLEAQQRSLDDQTSYATVSLSLLGPLPKPAVRKAKRQQHHQQQHGFPAGLSAGWRALRATVSAVLTAVGALLPFAAAAAILAGCGIAAGRRLARLRRRRSRPSTAS